MKVKTPSKIMALLVVFAMIFTVVGCAKTQDNDQGSTSDKKETTASNDGTESEEPVEEVTLDIMLHLAVSYMDDLVADFESKNPGIKVNYKTGQHVDKGIYSTVLQAEDVPDICLLGSGAGRIMPLANAGLLEDLTDAYEERGWVDTVVPSILETLKKTSGGKVYEVSNGMDVFTILYHKDIFKELGLTPPDTYDGFVDMLKTIKDSGQLPLVVGVKDGVMGGHMISSFWQAFCGRDFVTGLLFGDESFADPKSIEAAEALNELVEKGYINNDCTALNYTEASAIFAAKNAACFLTFQSYLDQFVEDGSVDLEKVGSMVIPSSDPSRPSIPIAGLSQCWVMASNSKNREAAYKWLDYIESEDYVGKLAEIGGWFCGIGNIKIDDVDALNIEHPIVKAAFEILQEGGAGYNCSPYLVGNLKSVYFESMQNMFGGSMTPEEAMQNMQNAKEASDK
jgi:raffinose/stachyose/melibiose transport system substrate-binding protein